MGQEASLPEQQDEDFVEQAKAPPSAADPNDMLNGNGRSKPVSGGRRIVGAMFQRGNHPHGHDYDKEAARVAAEAGEMPYMEGAVYSNGPSVNYGDSSMVAAAHNGQFYQNHQYTPEQQYYQQQQTYESQHEQQMMQQQQHYQLPQQHDARIQHAIPTQHGSEYPPAAGAAYNSDANGAERPGSAKKPAALRSLGKGAALLNSMRNLSIASSFKTAAAPGNDKKGKEVNDWEQRWDEDDDDSGEEEEEVDLGAASQPAPPHPPLRPGMDGGHSNASLSPTKPQAPVDLLSDISPMMQQQQQQQHPEPPDLLLFTPPQTSGKSMPPNQAMSAAPPPPPPTQQLQTTTNHHVQQQFMVSDDDGVEWDSGAAHGPEKGDKPNVKMFLPMLRVLGKGSFGKVVLVQKRVGTDRGQLFAMKILRKTHLVKRRQIERTRTERKVLSAVNHPFIMRLHYAFQTEDKLYLVLDYCPGGELFFHLSRFRRFPERVARFYAAELLLAIGHLHKRGIIYRDLKPENVLLDAEGHVKLGDFGLAKAGIVSPVDGALSMCGTPEYMAPEVLSQAGHGFCVDYWGLGMLVYEMMTGLPPWYTTDRSKLFRRLKSAPLDIPSYFSPQSANCVSALLERNPRRRLGVTGIRTAMEHEFFRSINWRALYSKRVEAPIRPCEGWKAPEAMNGDVAEHPLHAEMLASDDLDAATSNFDSTFTRMPVETDDSSHDAQHSDESDLEELCADTFVGFTFDETDRDGHNSAAAAAAAASRQRTQHYQQHQE